MDLDSKLQMYPEGPIRDYASKRYKKYKKRYKYRTRYIKVFDDRIFLHKWYPWSYWGYKPRLVPQGWYNLDLAKQRYIDLYGKDSLRHVKWIKGKEALERDFIIGKRLYIGNKWERVRTKSYHPLNYTLIKKFSTSHRTDFVERTLITSSKLLASEVPTSIKTAKRVGDKKLSHIQREKQEKAKNLYADT